ncbi:MAG TPA: hypothetical protein VLW50_31455 [Streptosporangiaceae bacterium]|nr:hypothetical protein [Streptosporangiaceae bacterium]
MQRPAAHDACAADTRSASRDSQYGLRANEPSGPEVADAPPGEVNARRVRARPERAGGSSEGSVAVSVELGEFTIDVDGVGAVEVHIAVVGGPDAGEYLLIDLPLIT